MILAQTSDRSPWSDTTFIIVKLQDTSLGKKIVVIDIGQKATIFLNESVLKAATDSLQNDFNKKYISKITRLLNADSKKMDTIYLDPYMEELDYVVGTLLKQGRAYVYYKKQKAIVPYISHRLEKYGMYAHRFFYLPDGRPFFSWMEYSGIIEDHKYFSDPKELEKLGAKLAGLRKE